MNAIKYSLSLGLLVAGCAVTGSAASATNTVSNPDLMGLIQA